MLKGQTKLVSRNPLDARLQANFLSDVSLEGSTLPISAELLSEIKALADVLRHANAQACIRKAYLDLGSPEVINAVDASKLWKTIMGKENSAAVAEALARGQAHGPQLLSYGEIETALLTSLTESNALPTLSKQQRRAIEPPRNATPPPELAVEGGEAPAPAAAASAAAAGAEAAAGGDPDPSSSSSSSGAGGSTATAT